VASAAAIAGIAANGLGWRKIIRLSDLVQTLCEQSDADDPDMGIVIRAVHHIAKRTKAFMAKRFPGDDSLDETLDELLDADGADLEEIHARLDEVWDFFDYERVLVK